MIHSIPQTTNSIARPWLARLLFLCLLGMLGSFFVMGTELYYKFMLINNIGLHGRLNQAGEFEFSPIAGLAASEAGLQDGDILVAVNGRRLPPNVMQAVHQLSVSPDHRLILEIRGKDGTLRNAQIPLDQRMPALFGLSALTLSRVQVLLDILLALSFSIPALIIVWWKSNDRLALFIGITLVLIGFRYTQTILFEPNVVLSILVFLLFAASRILLLNFLFVFPNGVYIQAWTKRFAVIGGIWAVISLFIPSLYGLTGGILEILILTTGLCSQIYRYRHVSSLQEKQQTKWIVFGMVVAFAANYAVLLAGVFPAIRGSELGVFRYQLISRPVVNLSLLALPLTVSVSIFRFRLYDIDILINRALVYGTLTAILSGLSVALIGFFQRLTLGLTGEKTEAATVLTTLIVASTITPLKNYVQMIVDKRFKEAPNASKKLKTFIENVHSRLFAVNTESITQNMLQELVLAFDATGGAVYLKRDHPSHVTRGWDGRFSFQLPIRGSQKEHGCLMLGGRSNGSEYSEHDRRLISEVVHEIAFAIEQDEKYSMNTLGATSP